MLEYIERTAKAKWEALPAEDTVIFTLGAFLGANGYTPITAFLNFLKLPETGVVHDAIDIYTAFQTKLLEASTPLFGIVKGGTIGVISVLSPIFGIIAGILGDPPRGFVRPPVTFAPLAGGASPSEVQKGFDISLARTMNAAIGALEAYALTRPGTIGGILQGIGQIIPG